MRWVATIENIEIGFFVPRDELAEDTRVEAFLLIGVAAFEDQLQFFHVRVFPDAEPPSEHFVLNFNGARVTQEQWSRWLEALRPAHLTASACLMLASHDHAVEVLFAESSSACATAAAVAAVMYSASWDERVPIPVGVSGHEMAVYVEPVDGRLRASVEGRGNAP